MRSLLTAAALFLAMVLPAAAFDDPKAAVEAFYAPYLLTDFDQFIAASEQQDTYLSEGLSALFEADRAEAEAAGGGIGRIDFDLYINGQDFMITELAIGDAEVSGEMATVPVSFLNFETQNDLFITLVLEADDWKIDDVENFNPEFPYRLREILEAPM